MARAKSWPGLVGVDYVKEVSHKEVFLWDERDQQSAEFQLARGPAQATPAKLPAADIPIVAYDFGVKYNILRRLRQSGFRVTVVPATTPAQEALRHKPAGVFLSNGPGDPAALGYAVGAVKDLVESGIPIFGICLGHQILGQAFGGKTFKLKFGHHGGNQPVINLDNRSVDITAQNHSFAVDVDSIPDKNVRMTHVNLNDNTCEGMEHKTLPIFSVQYHPEAAPGPHDAAHHFDRFIEMIKNNAQTH